MFLINLLEGQDWTGTATTQNFIKKNIAGIFLQRRGEVETTYLGQMKNNTDFKL